MLLYKNYCKGDAMISKEQWAEIESQLSGSFGRVKLEADQFKNVQLQIARYKKLSYCILVFIDGTCEYKWGQTDCEERRRFCCETRHYLYSKKTREEAQKKKRVLGKEWVETIMKQYSTFFPAWTSFTKLKRHLLKNNKELTVLSIGSKEVWPFSKTDSSGAVPGITKGSGLPHEQGNEPAKDESSE
jgi:hypothetical protein